VRARVCGTGVVEPGQVCDSGALNGSYAACAGPGPRCGDGVVDGPEDCDDGNTNNSDGCTNSCQLTCGEAADVAAGPASADPSVDSPVCPSANRGVLRFTVEQGSPLTRSAGCMVFTGTVARWLRGIRDEVTTCSTSTSHSSDQCGTRGRRHIDATSERFARYKST